MLSAREKFLLALSISDEGLEMMLQRVRRDNPGLPEKELCKILKQEIQASKNRSDYIPSYLTVKKYD